ncbi:MAG: M56 family metallopeptidase [Clostridia bacterium]|nr:M56 family metallopeptidase [Clostridia bacterium]
MTAQLFPVLFDMSLGAAFVIAAVLLLRLFCHRFPRRYFLILWAVVLLRLLCPILPESELSVIPPETLSFAQETALPERSEVTVLSAADAAMRAVGDTLNGGIDTVYVKLDREPIGREPSGREPSVQSMIPAVTAYHDQIWLLFLEKLWLGGVAVLVLRQIILDIRLRRRLKTAIPYPADLPAGLLPDRCRVCLADDIPTAFVLGILRPTIYLPSDLSADAAVYVLAHESVHVRRLDPLWKLLSAVALCLHWFNPLVWAAFHCASADLEYACDEAAPKLLSKVLPEADDNMTASYAQALLNVSCGKARLGMLALDLLTLSGGNVPRRIRRLLCETPKRVFCIMLLVICIVVCLFCIGNPPAQFDTDDVRMCTLDSLDIPTEHGKTLVDAINDASRSVNRTYDAIGQNPLDHTAVITFADGSYLEVNYLYTSGYSFNPAHPGEDDYTTVLWHRDALGNTVGTWVMEYDFDAVFQEWMIAAEGTPGYGNVLVHAPADSEIGMAVMILADRQVFDVPLLSVAYDNSVDYDRVPEITLSEDAILRLSGFGGNTLRVGEDYYENRGSDTVIEQQTYTLHAENDGAFVLPITYRNPQREESAVYYIAAEECRYCFKVRFPLTKTLTLDDVKNLSSKGMELTWSDFAGYRSIETGSGLYIRVYEIDETFELWIGGGSPIGTPMYIYLARADDLDTRIDIRYGRVEEFIEENKPQTILHAPADSETGLAVVVCADGLISDLPLFAVPYENALDYNRLPVINVSGNAVVRLIGFDGDTLRIGEDYYENHGDITFIQPRTQTLTADDDGAFVLSIEHRNPNRDESAVYYVAADDVRYCFKVQFVSEKEWSVQPLENETVDS